MRARLPTLLSVIVLAFLMVHAAPGGPFDAERILAPEIEANIERHYRLDEPLPQQFVRYLGGLVHGDLGPSYRYIDRSVNDLIATGLPVSLRIGALAIVLALLLGVAAGSVAALNHDRWLDRIVSGLAMTGISIPVFVVAPLLILLLAVRIDLLPAGWSSTESLSRYVLPVVTLALPQLAYIAKLTPRRHARRPVS